MHLKGDDKGSLPEERMEWVGDNNFAAQTPGIMASRRTEAENWAVVASPARGIRRFGLTRYAGVCGFNGDILAIGGTGEPAA